MKLPKSHHQNEDVNVDETVSDMEQYPMSECNAKKFLKLPGNGTESGMSSASNATTVSSSYATTCSSSSSSASTSDDDEYNYNRQRHKVLKIRSSNRRHRHFKIQIEDIMEEDCDIQEFQGSLLSSSNTMNTADTESTAYYTNSPGSEIEEKMVMKSE